DRSDWRQSAEARPDRHRTLADRRFAGRKVALFERRGGSFVGRTGTKSGQRDAAPGRGITPGVPPGHPCGPPHSGQNLAGLGIGLPQLMQNLVVPAGASGAEPAGAAGFMAFITCCAIAMPAPSPMPAPAMPPPSLAAAMGIDCATWNCV